MKKILFLNIIFLFCITNYSWGDCFLGCLLSPGTTCVNGECVPNTTPTPTPISTPVPEPTVIPTPIPTPSISVISLPAVPMASIIPTIYKYDDIDFSNLQIYLTTTYSGIVSYYSGIYYNNGTNTLLYTAQKNISNTYSFVSPPSTNLVPMYVSYDFKFTGPLFQWQDFAFTDVLKNMPDTQKKSCEFIYGFSTKSDLSDFQGAAFIFK